MLNLGTWRSVGLDRILRFAWANGIRYVDTAKSYGSEPAIGRWLQAMPEVRKEIFLVTKDHPRTPEELIKQAGRAAGGAQDRLRRPDLHPRRGRSRHRDQVKWPKSKEFKETAEAIRKSGKAKFVGFSTHHPHRARDLQAAAEGGFVDVDHAPEQPLDRRGRRHMNGPSTPATRRASA